MGFNFCVAVRKLPIITASERKHLRAQTLLPAVARLPRTAGEEPPPRIRAPPKACHFNEKWGGGCSFHLQWRGKTIIRKTQTRLPSDFCNIFTGRQGCVRREDRSRGRQRLSTDYLMHRFIVTVTNPTKTSAEPVIWGRWPGKARKREGRRKRGRKETRGGGGKKELE